MNFRRSVISALYVVVITVCILAQDAIAASPSCALVPACGNHVCGVSPSGPGGGTACFVTVGRSGATVHLQAMDATTHAMYDISSAVDLCVAPGSSIQFSTDSNNPPPANTFFFAVFGTTNPFREAPPTGIAFVGGNTPNLPPSVPHAVINPGAGITFCGPFDATECEPINPTTTSCKVSDPRVIITGSNTFENLGPGPKHPSGSAGKTSSPKKTPPQSSSSPNKPQ